MELAIFSAFIIKHTIADYFLQYSWMIKDKGTYGAWGGIAHAKVHGLFTFWLLFSFSIPVVYAIMLALLDTFIHYHVDFVKSNVWKSKKLGPTDQLYWITHGVDQMLHLLTYVLIIGLTL